ncbi:sugar kinase [Streptomyces sp. NPDC051907]|uniref:sugar kinase n=1 Tax=Streptomyces sp. NPDC051907 TaxID=3155284 RepID=UPI0034313116
MVAFVPMRPGRLADVPSFVRGIGGAESNVACGLAAAGHRTKWVGRVGADGFGEHLVAAIGAYGVDTSAVQRDPLRPTGVYFRTAGERATDPREVMDPRQPSDPRDHVVDAVRGAEDLAEVVYYRAGSAASAMSPSTVRRDELWSGRVLHLSGITAALSPDCLALLRTLTAPAPGRPLVSFDVNYRVNLWREGEGPRVLLDLARGADVVFVGEDEAEAAWGLRGASAIRRALPEPAVLVVKQGAAGATAYVRQQSQPSQQDQQCQRSQQGQRSRPGQPGQQSRPGQQDQQSQQDQLGQQNQPGQPSRQSRPGQQDQPGQPGQPGQWSQQGQPGPQSQPSRRTADPPGVDAVTFVPALRVDVVAPVGAGDAFAAGFLSATLRGLPARERLRHGHLMAAATLTVEGDLGAPAARDDADRLVALDGAGWGRLRLGPGWTSAVAQDPQEVRTA